MIKRSCFTSIIAGFVSLLVLTESAPADLVNGVKNGDFSDDISISGNGWDITAGVVAWDIVDQAAFFKQDPDDDASVTDSTLSQTITVDPKFPILSFDVLMTTIDPSETDFFTVTLGTELLYTLPSTDVPPPLISGDSSSFEETVTRNVSFLINTSDPQPVDVKLEFNLQHSYDDGPTVVRLDNVALVPVPGALVLGSIGLSLAGCWLGKRRRL